MKKFLFVLLCTLISFTGFSTGKPSLVKTFTVQGVFLKKSAVEYTLYKITEDGEREIVETKKGLRTYKVDLEVGKTYLVVFTKGELSKSLHINPEVSGVMELDVDFRNNRSASLYYDYDWNNYRVRPYYEESEKKNG